LASEADRSCLFVASGTSTAAASIASSALLIRQYFEEVRRLLKYFMPVFFLISRGKNSRPCSKLH
jgi:hypothetical protein